VFAIEMCFDEESDRRVRAVWQRIADAGLPQPMLELPGAKPHVSLTALERLADPGAFAARLAELAASEPPLAIRMASAATFATAEGVLYLGVVATRELLELHARFYAHFERELQSANPWYRPSQWVPHCTLSLGLTGHQIGAALESCLVGVLPLDATLESVELVEPRRVAVHGRCAFAG
jgi:2'-5' RNA ligase